MASQKYTNLAQSSLSSAYTAGDSTIALQTGDGSLFPSSGDFIVAIDDPPAFFLNCTARSTDTLTVDTSGAEGTTAVNKGTSIKVTHVITAGVLDNIRSDLSGIGAIASLPGSGMKKGDRWRTTDTPIEFVYDGSNWKAFAFGQPVTLPTGSTFGSTDSIGTSTTDSSKGGMIFTGAGITDLGMWYKAKPTNSAVFAYSQTPQSFDVANSGIAVRENSTGKILAVRPSIQASGPAGYDFDVAWYTNASTFQSNKLRKAYGALFMPGPMYWHRFRWSGGNIYVDVSGDAGITWSNIYSQAQNSFFSSGPDQVGVIVTSGESLHLWGYSET
jgi:hypothetical protein